MKYFLSNRFVPWRSMLLLLATLLVAEAQDAKPWTATGTMTIARSQHTATLLNDGRVLIVGGDCILPPPISPCGGTAEIYDPATGVFTRTGKMRFGRSNHAATLLPDGRVAIMGGQSGGAPPLAVEIYDPQTGLFSMKGQLKLPHPFLFAALLEDGRIVVSGRNPTEIYDPNDGKSTVLDIVTPDGARPVALPNQRILFVGGSANWTTIYDLRTGTANRNAAATPSLSFAGIYDSLATLVDGSVLLTGGAPNGAWNSSTNGAVLYRAEGDDFVPVPEMPGMTDYRNAHTSTTLSDGTVLLFGGNEGGDMTHTVEIFDPATMKFRTIATPPDRASHTATLLPDGSVLIAGGSIQTDYLGLSRKVLNTADLYTPDNMKATASIETLPDAGATQGAVFHDGSERIASKDDPAAPGEIVDIYVTGLAEQGRLAPRVSIGGFGAEVLDLADAPGFPGLFRVKVRVPDGVAQGEAVRVRLNYLERPTNEVTIAVR